MNENPTEPRITPLHVEKKTFRRRLRGYDAGEVDDFLDDVSRELERLIVRVKDLERERGELLSEVERYRGMDDTLKEALVLAQRTADETRAVAHREAEATLAETRHRCREMEDEAQRRTEHLREELTRLQTERDELVARLRTMVESFATRLEEFLPPRRAAVSLPVEGDGPDDPGDAAGEP